MANTKDSIKLSKASKLKTTAMDKKGGTPAAKAAKDSPPWDDPPTPDEDQDDKNGGKKAPKFWTKTVDDPIPAKPIIGEVDNANIVEGKRTRMKVSPVAEVAAPVTSTLEKKTKKVKEAKEAKQVNAKAKAPNPKPQPSPPKSPSPTSPPTADPTTITPQHMKNDILAVVNQSLHVAENFATFMQGYGELAEAGREMDDELDDVLEREVGKRKAARGKEEEEEGAVKPKKARVVE